MYEGWWCLLKAVIPGSGTETTDVAGDTAQCSIVTLIFKGNPSYCARGALRLKGGHERYHKSTYNDHF
jgi:hypothetical protein